ncbi:PepSY domain-containing protein [Hoeflea prorocentri]|uniref:PepSY domain-containing protein n=1 Tax=Hoeflea prorocentri TaxID=1922333 RepID=A0A9X3UL48_9HYPH|nr:PepSY domain-containing protein [Hoeflea prorocentri]MCY6382571.1 PepSY domain-containing protein [Hoeflea prorocentri]MDA5400371.1 PepSY domain-containing protein [Hoeflea prorocentri]
MKTATLLLASALALTGATAYAAVAQGDVIGTSETEIRARLESAGYTVEKIVFEDDEIEVEAFYKGAEMEIELSRATGAVLEIEAEDDDEDDD